MDSNLSEIVKKVCSDFNSPVEAVVTHPDWLYINLLLPPKTSLSSIINSVKGVTSRRLKSDALISDDYLVDGALWTPSYLAVTENEYPHEKINEHLKTMDRLALPKASQL